MSAGHFSIGIVWDEDDLRRVQAEIENELAERLAAGSQEFAVELLKRAKMKVPQGSPDRKVHRSASRDGLSHPGALQRSGKREVAVLSRLVTEHVISFATRYAAYQHGGKSWQSGYTKDLQYSRRGKQANFLYDMGHRPDPSPVEDMVREGYLERIVSGGIVA